MKFIRGYHKKPHQISEHSIGEKNLDIRGLESEDIVLIKETILK